MVRHEDKSFRTGRGAEFSVGVLGVLAALVSLPLGLDMLLDDTFGNTWPVSLFAGGETLDLSVDGETPLTTRLVAAGLTGGGAIAAIAGPWFIKRSVS